MTYDSIARNRFSQPPVAPGFDTIDYGQEDYVFGSSTADARHWDAYVLKVFQEHTDELSPLF